jgi:SulP family sulfate permease
MLRPKLLSTLRGYDRRQLGRDTAAGVIVGIVALPLSIAFAIASGVTPDRGLWTAIIAGFLISVLGGSRVQIGGPTGAFVVIIYGIVQQHGVAGLTIATFMAGLILIALGLLRLGMIIRFIPRPVIIGFTAGIAVLIAVGQLKDALGLAIPAMPGDVAGQVAQYARFIGTINPAAAAITLASLTLLMLWPRVSHRIPGPLVVLLTATAVVQLAGLDVETIGSRFGEIRATLPTPVIPELSWDTIRQLVGPAITIALLGAIESLLSAVVADGMIGASHRSNMELVAQGVANTASSILGGLPATGAIARTATNIKNGGRTPIAGIVHAITLLIITLFFGKWAALIPMAGLSAILLVVAYHMSEWRAFRSELTSPREDVAVMITAFVLTVLVDLTIAIEVGMVMAAFLFMKRMSDVAGVQDVTSGASDEDTETNDPDAVSRYQIADRVEIFEINGPLFFGATSAFKDTLGRISGKPRVLILRMRRVPVLDATALHTLADVVRRSRDDGTLVLLSGVQAGVAETIGRSTMRDVIGEENIYRTFSEAVRRANEEIEIRRVLELSGTHRITEG